VRHTAPDLLLAYFPEPRKWFRLASYLFLAKPVNETHSRDRERPDIDYPFHDKVVTVTTCGRICFDCQKINLSRVRGFGPASKKMGLQLKRS
jgi:hypothetical protein